MIDRILAAICIGALLLLAFFVNKNAVMSGFDTVISKLNHSKTKTEDDYFDKVFIYVDAPQCVESEDEQAYLSSCYGRVAASYTPPELDPRNIAAQLAELLENRFSRSAAPRGEEFYPGMRQDQLVTLLTDEDVKSGKAKELSKDPNALFVRVTSGDFPFNTFKGEEKPERAILIGISMSRIKAGVNPFSFSNIICLFNAEEPDTKRQIRNCITSLAY